VEIVSEPEISSPEEAKAYFENMKSILQYTEVFDVKMEQGSLRCDANLSIPSATLRSLEQYDNEMRLNWNFSMRRELLK